MLRIAETTFDDVMVIALRGRIVAGSAHAAVCDRVRHVLLRGYRHIVLDLTLATSSDASGASALLGALLDAKASGAQVRLVNATALGDLQTITALLRYFATYDSEADALHEFGSHSAGARGVVRTRLAVEQTSERPAVA